MKHPPILHLFGGTTLWLQLLFCYRRREVHKKRIISVNRPLHITPTYFCFIMIRKANNFDTMNHSSTSSSGFKAVSHLRQWSHDTVILGPSRGTLVTWMGCNMSASSITMAHEQQQVAVKGLSPCRRRRRWRAHLEVQPSSPEQQQPSESDRSS